MQTWESMEVCGQCPGRPRQRPLKTAGLKRCSQGSGIRGLFPAVRPRNTRSQDPLSSKAPGEESNRRSQ